MRDMEHKRAYDRARIAKIDQNPHECRRSYCHQDAMDMPNGTFAPYCRIHKGMVDMKYRLNQLEAIWAENSEAAHFATLDTDGIREYLGHLG